MYYKILLITSHITRLIKGENVSFVIMIQRIHIFVEVSIEDTFEHLLTGRFLNQRFISYQRFISRASLHFSSVSRHLGVSISGCSGRAWRREQSERSGNGQGASINDAKRQTGREKCPRRTRCSRRAPKENSFPKRQGDHVGATIDQRLIKFWRERSSRALSAADSQIVFTPASIRCPIMPYHVLFPLHDEANMCVLK